MSIIKSALDHTHFYNKFIKKYNDSKDKSNAISEIKTQRDILSDKEKRDEKKVSDHLNKLNTIAMLPIFPANPGDNELNILNMKALKKVLDDFKDKIKYERHIDFSEHLLPFLKTTIETSFPSETIGHYPATKCIKVAEAICSLGESIKRCREKQMHLNRIIDQAVSDDYPSKLEKWKQDGEDEKQQPVVGAAKKKMKQKEVDYQKYMPTIIRLAVSVMKADGQNLDYYITPAKRINGKLYNNIFNKMSPSEKEVVTINRLRSWLDKALEDRKLKKLIKKEKESRKE